jgi:transposase-like protein
MTRHTDTVEVILKDQRRRRWSSAEKEALVRRTYEPGMSVSLVARQEGVSASLLFLWRKLERQGALTAVSAGEAVVPASELAAARAEIAKLQLLTEIREQIANLPSYGYRRACAWSIGSGLRRTMCGSTPSAPEVPPFS